MHRSSAPPRRVLAVAATLSAFPAGEGLWRTVSDTAVMEATGYSRRSVQLAWQEIADMGLAEVGRAADGDTRLVRPSPHALWQSVFAVAAEVQS